MIGLQSYINEIAEIFYGKPTVCVSFFFFCRIYDELMTLIKERSKVVWQHPMVFWFSKDDFKRHSKISKIKKVQVDKKRRIQYQRVQREDLLQAPLRQLKAGLGGSLSSHLRCPNELGGYETDYSRKTTIPLYILVPRMIISIIIIVLPDENLLNFACCTKSCLRLHLDTFKWAASINGSATSINGSAIMFHNVYYCIKSSAIHC